jgi:signal transduction histidine kinase/class 3 adenylate cyclase/two-component SAPR family response regulator
LAHLSNFRHARGGMWYSPKIGLRQELSNEKSFKLVLDASIVGILIIIALYHIILFLQRREDTPSLFFALFCSGVAIRQWTTAQLSQELGLLHSPDGFELLFQLEYISIPLVIMGGGLFIHALIPGIYFKRFVYGFTLGLGGLLVLFTLAVDTVVFSDNLNFYNAQLIFTPAAVIAHLVYRSFLGNKLAPWVLLSFSVLVVGGVNDILQSRHLIDTAYIGPYTFIVFVLMQSGILSGMAAQAHRKAKHLSENLKKEVSEQTKDLQSKTLEALEATQQAIRAKQDSDALKQVAEKSKEEADALRADAEEQAEKLKELDKQKTAFFQNMSHELRTPLTLILNPLEDESKEQPNNKNLEVATKNSRRLLRLVNQLLDFQKLEAGKKDLKLAPVDISRFTQVCADYFHSACSSKSISFSVSRDGEPLQEDAAPLFMMGEVDALEKVLFNYLSNALKYTPKDGEVELGITTTKDRVKIWVQDTGAGISKEGQEKLFQVFSQVDETTTRAYEGTGLGLALVKSLTEEMGGQVGVESEPGKGSTFWADFPTCGKRKEHADVLIIDDEEAICRSLTQILLRDEHINRVETAQTSKAARMLLEEYAFRIVICDEGLQGESGTDFLAQVALEHPDMRRILCTGQDSLKLMQKAVNEAWVHQIILKPFDSQKLVESISRLVQDNPIHQEIVDDSFEVKSWLLEEAQGETGVDDSGVFKALDESAEGSSELILVVDDLADMRDLIASSLKKKNYRVATAPNGKRGVEIAKEIRPDLIITDWMMPVMSGPELIEDLKKDDKLNSVPIVLLTAKSDEESKLIGTTVGADSFLGKPFNNQELGSIVKNLLSLKSREREVEALNTQLTEVVLKRYLPPDLVDQIVSGQTSIDQKPEGITGTILFSDLAGFTDLSEHLRASKLARILNEYLSEMVQVIYEHGGTIDKFIGDAIMVIFGAPTAMAGQDQAKRAAVCALAMQARMVGLNQRWADQQIPELKMRIGIHHGPVVVGTFGCEERSDYTAIGPTVNMASRIEAACEPGEVLVSGQLCDLLPPTMATDAGSFELKGIDGEQRLYKLVSS